MHVSALSILPYPQRYYGDSLPFGKESFDPVAMGFLSVEQALADFAVLIGSLRQDYSGITKVVTFGGRYSITLPTVSYQESKTTYSVWPML